MQYHLSNKDLRLKHLRLKHLRLKHQKQKPPLYRGGFVVVRKNRPGH